MNQWYKKSLGTGTPVFQHLRDLRELRFQCDRDVSDDRTYIVATDVSTTEVIAFLPPGNILLAQLCGAIRCEKPDFAGGGLVVLSTEDFPIVTPFAEQTTLGAADRKASDAQ